MSGLIPWNNNSPTRTSGNNTSSELEKFAKETSVVSTAKPVRWGHYSDSDVNSAKENLKQHKKYVQNFLKMCKINIAVQKLDTVATKGLSQLRTETTKELCKKNLIIEKQIASQRKIAETFVEQRSKIHSGGKGNGQGHAARSEAADFASNTLFS